MSIHVFMYRGRFAAVSQGEMDAHHWVSARLQSRATMGPALQQRIKAKCGWLYFSIAACPRKQGVVSLYSSGYVLSLLDACYFPILQLGLYFAMKQ